MDGGVLFLPGAQGVGDAFAGVLVLGYHRAVHVIFFLAKSNTGRDEPCIDPTAICHPFPSPLSRLLGVEI